MALNDGKNGQNADAADLADRAIDKARGGRRDGSKEGNPDPKKLKEALPGLARALKQKRDEVESYNKKRKAVAKACGFMSNVVDRAAAAMLAEDEDRAMSVRYAEQLEMALEVTEKLAK